MELEIIKIENKDYYRIGDLFFIKKDLLDSVKNINLSDYKLHIKEFLDILKEFKADMPNKDRLNELIKLNELKKIINILIKKNEPWSRF